MRNLTCALFLGLCGVAVAQKMSSVTVDGKTIPNGVVTVNGKQYLSLDVLKQSGIQTSGNQVFILTNPKPAQPPYKLTGCVNEWLWNGATRFRIDAVELQGSDPKYWQMSFSLQPAIDRLDEYYNGNKDIKLKFGNNDVVYIGNPAWVNFKTDLNYRSSQQGSLAPDQNIQVYRSDAESPSDPPTQLVIPTIRVSGVTYPSMTVDLTCKK